MIEVNKDLGLTVTIPQQRYEELLDIETRVDVAVERMINDEYCKTEDVLRILGTELALQKADEIREKERADREAWERRNAAFETGNANVDL